MLGTKSSTPKRSIEKVISLSPPLEPLPMIVESPCGSTESVKPMISDTDAEHVTGTVQSSNSQDRGNSFDL